MGGFRQPRSLLDRIQGSGLTADAVTCRSAMIACGRAGRWEAVLLLLAEAERLGSFTAATYAAAMDACVTAGRWECVLVLCDTMDSRRLRESDATRAAVVRACALGGLWQQGLVVLAQAGLEVSGKQSPTSLSHPHKPLDSDPSLQGRTAATNAAIVACGRAGRWSQSLALLSELQQARLSCRPQTSHGTRTSRLQQNGGLQLQCFHMSTFCTDMV